MAVGSGRGGVEGAQEGGDPGCGVGVQMLGPKLHFLRAMTDSLFFFF